MKDITSDLVDRNVSIMRFLDHIEEVSEQRGKIEVIVVLKASFFVALYNNIEATVYGVLEQVHHQLGHIKFDELTDKLKDRMVSYCFGKGRSSERADPVEVQRVLDSILMGDLRFPSIGDFLKRKTIFSGNLDARRLSGIAEEYGIAMQPFSANTEHMLTVKNKRNKIAHGEVSLSDAGKGIKNDELTKIFHSVNGVLGEFITYADVFLKEEHYRIK